MKTLVLFGLLFTVLLFSGCAALSSLTAKDCKSDVECFKENLKTCTPAKITYDKEFAEKQNMFISNNTFSYQYLIIEGSSGLIIGLKSNREILKERDTLGLGSDLVSEIDDAGLGKTAGLDEEKCIVEYDKARNASVLSNGSGLTSKDETCKIQCLYKDGLLIAPLGLSSCKEISCQPEVKPVPTPKEQKPSEDNATSGTTPTLSREEQMKEEFMAKYNADENYCNWKSFDLNPDPNPKMTALGCWVRAAIYTNDLTICERFKDDRIARYDYIQITGSEWKSVDNPLIKDICYYRVAEGGYYGRMASDSTICEYITDPEFKRLCKL